MADAYAAGTRGAASTGGLSGSARIGWRNLWRNPRRTWLTAGGIAFAIALVTFAMAMQRGAYAQMRDLATGLFNGDAQIQTIAHWRDASIDQGFSLTDPAIAALRRAPALAAVAPRARAFALVAVGERSFGAEIVGVDPLQELGVARLAGQIVEGHGLTAGAVDEAVLGVALARNLGVRAGDELTVLGSARTGGVAALALQVVGLFESGSPELDRGLLLAPLATVQEAFALGDDAHVLVLRFADGVDPESAAAALQARLPAFLELRTWERVMPEVQQSIEVDRLSGWFFYALLLAVVALSVVNTFVMILFERTREFGMLKAIGMKPGRLVLLLQFEALGVWLLGTAIGSLVALALVAWLGQAGLALGDALEAAGRALFVPSRLYPELPLEYGMVAPVLLLVGTQLAALIPALRLFRLPPAAALRNAG